MVLSPYPAIATESEVYYPERDGKPIADNTIQFRWILVLYYNLEWLFAEDPEVFVAGDLLWYPVEGRSNLSAAPDVLTIFGERYLRVRAGFDC